MAFSSRSGWRLALLVLLCTQPAFAEPTDAEKETARSLMDDGDRLRANKDLPSALQRYQAAHEIMRVPTTGIEVANTYASMGKLVEARRAAIEVANLPVAADEPTVFAEARQQANALATSLAERIPAVLVQVSPNEAQATLVVDGVQIPAAAAGLPYKTNPGTHTLEATAPGYQPQKSQFSLEEGKQFTVGVSLVPVAAEPAPAPAPVATAAPAPAPSNQPASDQAEPAPSEGEGESLTSAYVALGIAGLGVVVGSATGALSLSRANSAKDFCDGNVCSSEARDDIDSSKSLANVSNIAFGVGIIAGLYAAFTFLSRPDSPAAPAPTQTGSDSKLRTAVVLGPKQTSAVVWGSF